MNWEAFAKAAPELAAAGRKRMEETGLVLLGTLRKDGSPRISPIEPFLVEGELMLGMMWHSKKALDLVRDPRLTLHSATSDPNGSEGDFKLYGQAVDVQDAGLRTSYVDILEAKIRWRPPEPFHLFSVDIEGAGFIRFGDEQVAMRWTGAAGLIHLRHPNE